MRSSYRVVLVIAAALVAAHCSKPPTEPRDVAPKPVKAGQPAASTQAKPTPRQVTGEATLLLAGDIRGILKPCGCTVDLQKGGFDRLGPFLAGQRKDHPGAKLLHAGPLFYEESEIEAGEQVQWKRQSEVAAQLAGRVGFDMAGVAAVDLAAAGTVERYKALVASAKVQVTAANLTFKGQGPQPPRYLVQEIGTLKVGVFALAPPEEAKHVEATATITDYKEAGRKVVAELAGKVDVVVLLSGLGLRHTKRFVRAVPGVHFVVTGGLGEHPVSSDEAELVGSTRVMQFHREGRFVGRLAIRLVGGSTEFVDVSAPSKGELEALDVRAKQLEAVVAKLQSDGTLDKDKDKDKDKDHASALRAARHNLSSVKEERARLAKLVVTVPKDKSSFSFIQTPLPWDLPEDPDIKAIMDAFDKEKEKMVLANVGELPKAKPGEAVYVGVEACLECHDATEHFWKNSVHSHAWETLEKLNKTFDVKCVSCHVTGYDKPGGSLVGKTAGREDAQCEVCHGPGSLHVDAGEADTKTTIVRDPTEAVCVTCHNSHHSPKFDFKTWRAKVIVPGHGLPAP